MPHAYTEDQIVEHLTIHRRTRDLLLPRLLSEQVKLRVA